MGPYLVSRQRVLQRQKWLERKSLESVSVIPNILPLRGGYLVQYTDGSVLNVPHFTGYVSWSPKYVFDNAYTVVPNTEK